MKVKEIIKMVESGEISPDTELVYWDWDYDRPAPSMYRSLSPTLNATLKSDFLVMSIGSIPIDLTDKFETKLRIGK